MTGVVELVRLILRRDRFLLVPWLLVTGLLPALIATATDASYRTPAERLSFAAQANADPAELAARGPVFVATTGGLTAWTVASSGMLLGGLVSLLLVIRHTRADEQAGRRELLGAGAVGRYAPLAAPLLVVGAGNLAVAALAALGTTVRGLPVAGGVALGLVFALGGVLFAAVGAVAAQLVAGAGAARGLAVGVMGVLFGLVAVGEVGRSGLVWASPFGWARRVQAFAGERWWVLLLFAGSAAALVTGAFALSARRDVGAGLWAVRQGPAVAGPGLRSPLALAWRLHRGSALGWTAGLTLLGLLLGAAVASLGTQLDTAAFREVAARLGGGDPAAVFFRVVLYLMAQVVAAASVAAALRVRGEETAGFGDALLAGPVGRGRWLGGHLVVTAAGSGLALLGLGLGAGFGYGTPAPIIGMTLAYLPACLVFAGVAVALFGWAPRLAAPVTWTLLGLSIALDFLGEFHLVDPAVLLLSPFVRTQMPLVLGSGVAAALLGLTIAAAVLGGAGLVGLQRRDLEGR